MARRDIIVIGASAGGVDALTRLAAALPKDLAAAVLMVTHMPAGSPSRLAEQLDAAGPLRAARAIDGEPIVANRIYVAVPDRHLMIEGTRIRLSRGPRESHARPSVDVLFRSAAFSCGRRVIGVVLTGMLDDGTAGLWAIKDRGGVAIVQSAEDAEYPSMPLNAAKNVVVDHVVKLAEVPEILRRLTREEIAAVEGIMPNRNLEIENRIALGNNALEGDVRSLGPASFYTCPECHGSMVAIEEGSIRRFRCHTGHGFSAAALSDRAVTNIEKTLWAALAQLEEHEILLRELEQEARKRADADAASRHAADAADTCRIARQVREVVLGPMFRISPGHH
jgi:two-component system chemotaxis response regulator CheB